MLQREKLKVLLVQVRDDPLMQLHEQKAVSRSGEISVDQITVLNGIEQGISIDDLQGHHILIVGGTGDYSIFDNVSVARDLPKVLNYAKKINYPVLGSCWGGQFLAQLFGGEVASDPKREEVGSFAIHPTARAHDDPIFRDAPEEFWAQVGHHESIVKLPKGAVNLLASNRCGIQAFTWPGSALYGLQIHSDLSKDELQERVTHYRDNYVAEQSKFDAFLASLKDSPYTDNLIAKFIDRLVLPLWAKA